MGEDRLEECCVMPCAVFGVVLPGVVHSITPWEGPYAFHHHLIHQHAIFIRSATNTPTPHSVGTPMVDFSCFPIQATFCQLNKDHAKTKNVLSARGGSCAPRQIFVRVCVDCGKCAAWSMKGEGRRALADRTSCQWAG